MTTTSLQLSWLSTLALETTENEFVFSLGQERFYICPNWECCYDYLDEEDEDYDEGSPYLREQIAGAIVRLRAIAAGTETELKLKWELENSFHVWEKWYGDNGLWIQVLGEETRVRLYGESVMNVHLQLDAYS
ncbi:MAG: hypothetical protein KDD60_10675, partial [Bdellovibrionales bacterium]|nr:hypothetical protein [Bdellovibrionales bacterium]